MLSHTCVEELLACRNDGISPLKAKSLFKELSMDSVVMDEKRKSALIEEVR